VNNRLPDLQGVLARDNREYAFAEKTGICRNFKGPPHGIFPLTDVLIPPASADSGGTASSWKRYSAK